MQEINVIRDIIIDQLLCRKDSSHGVEKKSLKEISSRVNDLIKIFKELPVQGRKEERENVKFIIHMYNEILDKEDKEDRQGFRSAIYKTYKNVFKVKPIEENVVVIHFSPEFERLKDASLEEPVKPLHSSNNTAERELCKLIGGNVKEFVSYYGIKHILNEVLEDLRDSVIKEIVGHRRRGELADVDESLFKETLLTNLLKKVDEEYSPVDSLAGNTFTEKEIKELAGQNLTKEKLEKSAYREYNLRLLWNCIQNYKAGKSWKECPITHYRMGSSKADLTEFKNRIRRLITKEMAIDLALNKWSMEIYMRAEDESLKKKG